MVLTICWLVALIHPRRMYTACGSALCGHFVTPCFSSHMVSTWCPPTVRSYSRGGDSDALPSARRRQQRGPRSFFKASFPERDAAETHQRTAATTPEDGKMEDSFSPLGLARSPTSNSRRVIAGTDTADMNAAFAQIRANLIGRLDSVGTPFGPRPLVCELLPRHDGVPFY